MRISDWSSDVCSSDLGDRGRRLSGAAGAVRGLLPSAVTDQEPPHSGARFDRRGYACAFAHGHLAGRQLAGARSLRHVRCAVRESSRSASHTDRLWLSRSEEHTSELQSLMRISYAVFCLKKKKQKKKN